MVGGIGLNLGLYDEISIALLVILILSKVSIVRRIYSNRFVQLPIQLFGFMAYLYIFLTMAGTFVQKGGLSGSSLILMRTTDIHSAHYIAFLALMVFGFFTYVHPRPNFLRSIFFVMGATGFHEFFWNLFYLPTCFGGVCTYSFALSNGGLNLFTQGITVTFMLMVNLAYWYRPEFKEIIKMLPYWLGFMVLWELAGFYVTLDARLQAVTSQYYNDPYVNLVEILSWYIFLYPAFHQYMHVHPVRENWVLDKIKTAIRHFNDERSRWIEARQYELLSQ